MFFTPAYIGRFLMNIIPTDKLDAFFGFLRKVAVYGSLFKQGACPLSAPLQDSY